LLAHGLKQKTLLAGYLGQRVKDAGFAAELVAVELAMRYGNPSLDAAIERLRAAGCDRLLVVPLFPQYSASATASVFDAVFARAQRMRRVPGVRTIASFHDDPGYVRALAQGVNDYWMRNGRPDVLLLSFHGLPRHSLDLGDPYHCQCHKTARLLATELGLEREQYRVTFQSRFGRARWLEPYTRDTLLALAKDGVRRVDVACPGFVADCLETLEEIAIEGKQAFLGAGGVAFHAIPCLNEHPAWMAALTDLVFRHLQGWLAPPPDPAAAELTLARAKAMGASR
jgi:ferrochelatase